MKPWFFAIFLWGCSAVNPEYYQSNSPKLSLEEYFAGHTRGFGLVQDRFGKLIKHFVVDIQGEWDGNVLTLNESFVYSDGKKEKRVWRISKSDQHSYRGTANDVIGFASGKQFGNALNWRYTLELPVGESRYNVNFDDWMFLVSDEVLLNRAKMSKFGVELGEVTLSFHKLPNTDGLLPKN